MCLHACLHLSESLSLFLSSLSCFTIYIESIFHNPARCQGAAGAALRVHGGRILQDRRGAGPQAPGTEHYQAHANPLYILKHSEQIKLK